MELDKLINEVKVKTEENLNLKEEQSNLQEQIVDNMNKNFYSLFYPEVEQLWNVVNKLSYITQIYIPDGYFGIDNKPLIVNFKVAHDQSRFYLELPDRSWNVKSKERKKASNFNLVKSWLPYFGTEEATLETLDVAIKTFAIWFERFLEEIDQCNESLKASVEALKNELNGSSAIEEKEDGSVEIKIIGKTYIGTVKEA